MEIRRGGKSYTADTLKALLRRFPDAEFYLLVGTDMLLDLGRWYRAEFIMQHVKPGCKITIDSLEYFHGDLDA